MMQQIERQLADESIKKANLEAYGLSSEDLKQIVKIINARHNPLNELNLRGNNIDDDGAQIISSIKHLRYLDMGINDLSDNGVKHLINNTPFESLDVSANNLTDKAIEALLSSSKLTWVDVTKNRGIIRESQLKLDKHLEHNKQQSQQSAIVLKI